MPTDDWQEYPECPYCGAIQEYAVPTADEVWLWTCHSCGKRFTLTVQVTRRYRATAMAEA